MASNDVAYRFQRSADLLTTERIVAGQEYVQRLITLGFAPDIAAWVYRAAEDDIQLVLVSDVLRRIGAKRMYEVLFEAYDKAITPKQIDPFDVGLYSTDMDMAQDLRTLKIIAADGKVRLNGEDKDVSQMMWNIGFTVPKIVHGAGIYLVSDVPAKAKELNPSWHRFAHNIHKLAA